MNQVNLIQIDPEQHYAAIREIVAQEMSKIKPVTIAAPDRALTTKQLMAMLDIDSYKGLQSWCKANKLFGKRCGKGNVYLESKVLAVLAK